MQLENKKTHSPGGQESRRWQSPGIIAVCMLVLIAAFYLLREHWAHIAGAWPYLLLLLCPLMHLFMHRGHGGHRH